jgi:hypothetical protein
MLEKIFSFTDMNRFRTHYLSKITALVTGVIFLNMSFFLAEVSMLKYNKKELIENIAKLLFNSGLEEERDGESSGADTTAKEVTLLLQQVQIHHTSSFLVSVSVNRTLIDHYLHANYSLSFFQPPDSQFS